MKKSLIILSSLLVLASCGNKQNLNEVSSLTNSSIFGGEKIGNDHFLGKVTVGLNNHDKNTICTGTIIAKDLILTAAHCTEGSDTKKIDVVFSNRIGDKKNSIAAVKYIEHQDYVHTNHVDNDIAIIKMSKSIPANFQIIDIEKSKELNLMAGETLHVAGFGKSVGFFAPGAGTLRATNVKVEYFSINEKLVVLNQREKRGICSGDSGGGSFAVIENQLVQVGINSYVLKKENGGSADCKNKAYQTSVAYHLDWIIKTMAELN